MDIKREHDKQLNEIFAKARALDKDAKTELINYLEKTIVLMEQELQDQEPDWSNLEYLQNEQASDFFEKEIVDYTIGWKCDEQEVIDFDKKVIRELKKAKNG